MKNKIKLSAVSMILSLSIIVSPLASTPTVEAAKKVYYVPGSSYAYHSSKNCLALRRSTNIKAISMKKAKAKGLTKCKMRGCW